MIFKAIRQGQETTDLKIESFGDSKKCPNILHHIQWVTELILILVERYKTL